MDYTIDTLPSRLMLGHQTETGVNDIRIDMSEWLERWPGLAISIWPTRPGETAAYPAVTVMDGNCVIWRVNSADTAIAGNGTVEIMGVADGKKALSKVMTTYIPRTTTSVTTEPPEAPKPWVDNVAALAGDAEKAAQRAENAAGEITGLSAAAQTLEAGAEATAEYADGVLTLGIPRGPQGVPGPKGDKGDTGAVGPQGEPGRDGMDAEVTADSIRAALGFEPADAAVVDTKLTEPAEGLAVGKYFRVAALDADGHAVLEAVDAPKEGLATTPTGWPEWTADEQAAARERMGLPGNFELAADIELTEETQVASINFGKYLRELYVVFSGTATGNGNAGITVNFDDGTNRSYTPTCTYWMNPSNRFAIAHIRLTQGIIYSVASEGVANAGWAPGALHTNLGGFAFLTETQKSIQGINMASYNNYSWCAGCKFTVYGVRA